MDIEEIKDKSHNHRAKSLSKYIDEMKTQEECVGFIDGFDNCYEFLQPQLEEANKRIIDYGNTTK